MGRSCPFCGSSEIDDDAARGDSTCMACGAVLEESTIVSDVNFQETSGGGHSLIGQFVSRDRAQPNTLMGVPGLLHQESREVTHYKGRKLIEQISSQLRINHHCVETAFNFFKMCVSRNFTRGRVRSHVVVACLYMTCRLENTPHLLLDFSDITQVNVFDLGRTLNFLSRSLKINLPTTDPCLYILRFAVMLDFKDKEKEVVSLATRLVQRMKRDWIATGRRPTGVCGAALLLAARSFNFNRTVSDIVRVVHVSEAVVRKRLDEFGQTPSGSLTVDEFATVDLEHCEDPPAFQESRRKAQIQKELEDEENELNRMENEIRPLEEKVELALEKKRRQRFHGSAMASVISGGASLTEESAELSPADLIVRNEIIDLAFSTAAESERYSDIGMSSTYAPSLESLGLGYTGRGKATPTVEPAKIAAADGDGELNLEGIDDDEIDTYILTSEEAELKTRFWMRANGEHLAEMERKRRQREEEEERDKDNPNKKKRRGGANGARKREPIIAATAQEAIEKIILEKKLSSKINYEILKEIEDLNGTSGSIFGTPSPARDGVRSRRDSMASVVQSPHPSVSTDLSMMSPCQSTVAAVESPTLTTYLPSAVKVEDKKKPLFSSRFSRRLPFRARPNIPARNGAVANDNDLKVKAAASVNDDVNEVPDQTEASEVPSGTKEEKILVDEVVVESPSPPPPPQPSSSSSVSIAPEEVKSKEGSLVKPSARSRYSRRVAPCIPVRTGASKPTAKVEEALARKRGEKLVVPEGEATGNEVSEGPKSDLKTDVGKNGAIEKERGGEPVVTAGITSTLTDLSAEISERIAESWNRCDLQGETSKQKSGTPLREVLKGLFDDGRTSSERTSTPTSVITASPPPSDGVPTEGIPAVTARTVPKPPSKSRYSRKVAPCIVARKAPTKAASTSQVTSTADKPASVAVDVPAKGPKPSEGKLPVPIGGPAASAVKPGSRMSAKTSVGRSVLVKRPNRTTADRSDGVDDNSERTKRERMDVNVESSAGSSEAVKQAAEISVRRDVPTSVSEAVEGVAESETRLDERLSTDVVPPSRTASEMKTPIEPARDVAAKAPLKSRYSRKVAPRIVPRTLPPKDVPGTSKAPAGTSKTSAIIAKTVPVVRKADNTSQVPAVTTPTSATSLPNVSTEAATVQTDGATAAVGPKNDGRGAEVDARPTGEDSRRTAESSSSRKTDVLGVGNLGRSVEKSDRRMSKSSLRLDGKTSARLDEKSDRMDESSVRIAGSSVGSSQRSARPVEGAPTKESASERRPSVTSSSMQQQLEAAKRRFADTVSEMRNRLARPKASPRVSTSDAD